MAARTTPRISKAPKSDTPLAPEPIEVEIADEEEGFDDITMPTKIRIGPFVHSIRPMDPMKSVSMNRIGEYDTLRLAIEIYDGMPRQRKAETLVHELFHGLWHVTGLRNDEQDDEEHAVTVLSMAMVQVIRDNPVLIAWLLQNLGDE